MSGRVESHSGRVESHSGHVECQVVLSVTQPC